MKKKHLITALKLLVLAIFIAITMVIVFKIWGLHEYSIFPIAYIFIIIGMFALGGIVFFRDAIYTRYSSAVYYPAVVVSVLYYISIMVITWLLKDLWDNLYLGVSVFLFLFYIALAISLMKVAYSKYNDILKQDNEKAKTSQINLTLLHLEQELIKKQSKFISREYDNINDAFQSMLERQKMSTPFGRIERDAIIEIENSINTKLETVLNEIKNLDQQTKINKDISQSVANAFEEIYYLIKKREKTIIQ